jgi:hypothetical protein
MSVQVLVWCEDFSLVHEQCRQQEEEFVLMVNKLKSEKLKRKKLWRGEF